MKKILVCANSEKAGITEAVIEKIIGKGLEASVFFPFRSSEGFGYRELICDNPAKACKESDLLICMGGDGTILYCSKLAAEADIPILGINYGHKGFIAAIEPEEIEKLDGILDGNYLTEERMMLSAEVRRGGASVYSDFGLNEVIIKSADTHPIKISVYGDGVEITAFSGDGIIAATPTGSTAYSMSAGGPIVEPNAKNIILTPVCAHALNAKAVVLMGDRVITIRFASNNPVRSVLAIDGNNLFSLSTEDEIIIRKAAKVTRLVVGTERSFYEIVKRKLNTDF